ncbi:MAG: DUF4197 domain-containing protein [Bacteroidia bacterium]|nr:DUF4197 domain-containing protein [Bacteroidia bacterium]
MKKVLLYCFIALYSLSYSQNNIPAWLQNLTQSEVGNALKDALKVGATRASERASAKDGFYKNPLVFIPFPEEAKIVKEQLIKIGKKDKVDSFEKSLNRAAEDASKKAANIFIDAILKMTLQDAKNILVGGDSAATAYLRKTSSNALYDAFLPIVQKSLESVGAAQQWKNITELYNKIPLVRKVDTDLPAYTTRLAVRGIFIYLAQEEQKIRKNPAARTTPDMQKVFGAMDKGSSSSNQ